MGLPVYDLSGVQNTISRSSKYDELNISVQASHVQAFQECKDSALHEVSLDTHVNGYGLPEPQHPPNNYLHCLTPFENLCSLELIIFLLHFAVFY
jgi:hypothetical protein